MFKQMLMTVGFVCLLAVVLTAAVPQLVSFQGILTDNAGNPVTGSVDVVFTIWDDPAGGNNRWTETRTVDPDDNGGFNIVLGTLNPILPSVFDGSDRWLGIRVGTDEELTPRTRLTSVPYSQRVATIDGATGGTITDSLEVQGNIHASGSISLGNTIFWQSPPDSPDNRCVVRDPAQYIIQADSVAITGKATIGPGHINTGANAFVAGERNTVSSWGSTVGGGQFNEASGEMSTVGGGLDNQASNDASTIAGGLMNIASGPGSMVAGGVDNTASGNCSFAAGQNANAIHGGAFVWSDASEVTGFSSTGLNQFLIRAVGGVGIGTASPSEQLEVNGTVKMTGFDLPTGAATGLVLTSDAGGVGTWQATAGGSGWADDGNAVRLETSTDSVGIGTTTPTAPLHVAGTIQAGDAFFFDETADVGEMLDAVIGFSYVDNFFDRRLRITAGRDDGWVNDQWIGNTQGAAIDLHGNAWEPTPLNPQGMNGDLDLVAGRGIQDFRGDIRFWTGLDVAERMRITPGGDVGIGTTVPNAALQVNGAISRQNTTLLGDNTQTHVNLGDNCTTSREWATISGGQGNTANGARAVVSGGWNNTAGNSATVGGGRDNTASGPNAIVAGGIENQATGHYSTVLGGSQDTVAGYYSFAAGDHVRLTEDADYTFAFGRDFETATPNAVIFSHPDDATRVGINKRDPALALDLPNIAGPAGRGRANMWAVYASIRLKENLSSIDNALNKVLALRGVYFDWKKGGKHDIGMIAEEVGRVVPEVVVYEENGTDAESMDYGRLTALLVEALKEQQKSIEGLKAEVQMLSALQSASKSGSDKLAGDE